MLTKSPLVAWLLIALSAVAPAVTVEFESEGLEAAVREAIGQPSGPIDSSDLAGLTELDASNRGIDSLGGVEDLSNLTSLDLSDNEIDDAGPLSVLVQ